MPSRLGEQACQCDQCGPELGFAWFAKIAIGRARLFGALIRSISTTCWFGRWDGRDGLIS